jgi:MHS family proline/betaine transporter-like MFS transporter
MGGETSGSYSFIVESAPEGQRARWVSLVACYSILPAAAAGLFILLLRFGLGTDAYGAWGWRIPFVVGGVLAAVGFWLRRRLNDAQEFEDAVREEPIRNPLREVLRNHGKSVVTVILLISLQGVTFNLILGYMSTYLVKVAKLDGTSAILSNTVAIVALGVLLPVFGTLTDRVGRKPMLFAGASWLVLTAYPAFRFAASGTVFGAVVGQLLIVIGATAAASASYVAVLELFPTSVRGTGHAISYNLGNALFGGTAPLVAAVLVTGVGSPIAPAAYIALIGLFGLVVTLFTPETKNVRLRSSVGGRVWSPVREPEVVKD